MAALANDIAVIGVTDYFSLEGFRELSQLVASPGILEELIGPEDAERARHILLIPNLELRSSVVVQSSDGEIGRVNFHVLFDPTIGYQTIEDHFLHRLMFTAESNPGGPDERWSLTLTDLAQLGERLRAHHAPFKDKSNLEAGMMNAIVAHEDVTSVLEEQPSRFAGRYLIVVAADEDLSEISWDGQGHQTRKLFIQKSDMLFSSNKSTRDFALGKLHVSAAAFKAEFKSIKPCIHGSDAHDYDSLFAPDQHRHLWIKADPTFEGLRQLLYEPESRVYIGEEPPAVSRVNERSTKYIDSLTFVRDENAGDDAKWFSGTVALNPGLVAIIGNKGSGKSALSDVIGLLGDTRTSRHFSFLAPGRFLNPRTHLANLFRARLQWRSGAVVNRALGDPIDETAPETVKYIPQNYLEEICSELLESHNTMFDQELKDVIFSHVSEADRLGQRSLDELIEYQTDETQSLIDQLTASLDDLNRRLIDFRNQLTDEYRQSLEGQLALRERELAAHDAARPAEAVEPTKNPEEIAASQAAQTELDEALKQLSKIDSEIESAQAETVAATRKIAAAGRLLDRIANLERQVDTFHMESDNDAQVLGVDSRSLVQLSVSTDPVVEVRAQAEAANEQARRRLGNTDDALPAAKRAAAAAVDTARGKLDEPTRRYEKSMQVLAAWKSRRDEIEGSESDTVSVKGLAARLAVLGDLPSREAELVAERLEVVRQIYAAKERLLAQYQDLYSPVQRFIDEHPVSQEQADLEFYAAMAVDGFVQDFLDMIHGGKRGSFQGAEGDELATQIVAGADFSNIEGVEEFLKSVDGRLRHVTKDGKDAPIRLDDQLRQHLAPIDMENLLFGLGYLKPRFELRWQQKPLDQLSPGERGNVLLVFYLLIDKRDDPLVIDQPEENLDNFSIATTLVPALKYAKDRRQIIIVTHNPNLAVVCDAEQIVIASLDKSAGNSVTYVTGAIENPVVTGQVVDILEGTKPLFDLRDSKYDVLERLGA